MPTFKARARTIDMLGRQQIAGSATAISELFKNAHDAYAKRVEVDFFRTNRLLVLRDNGIGMTSEEFKDKWLTLGTESKLDAKVCKPPAGETVRPMMGEKGIGRLAIASLGPVVLVLSRAKRRGKSTDIVGALVAWELFECPGVDLDQIDIPVRTFSGGGLPTQKDVAALAEEAKKSMALLRESIECSIYQRIERNISSFGKLNVASVARRLEGQTSDRDRKYGALSLAGSGHGTHFFIQPVDELLVTEADETLRAEDPKPLTKMLIGFTHQMRDGAPVRRIVTSFRYYVRDELVPEELVGDSAFFTKAEFNSADHSFVGHVDPKGNFTGTCRIFNEVVDYQLPSPFRDEKDTACGPFSIGFAYIQGNQKDSRLYHSDPDEYQRLYNRVQRFGGLYVYRDGIRILPYGNSDFDFLNIEERRNRGASYYFFSYRRMFGTIDLSRELNSKLHEKAGREGFRENRAYRQLRQICENLLLQLAAEFFRASAPQVERYNRQREELTRLEEIRRKREAHSKERRSEFDASIGTTLARIERGAPREEIDAWVRAVEGSFAQMDLALPVDETARTIIRLQSDALKDLERICQSYRVPKPRGIGLSRRLRDDYETYLSEVEKSEQEIFHPARSKLEALANNASARAHIAVDRRRRAEAGLQTAATSVRHMVREPRGLLEKSAKELLGATTALIKESISSVEEIIAESTAGLEAVDPTRLSDADFDGFRERLSVRVLKVGEERRSDLARALEVLRWSKEALSNPATASFEELTEALEEEVLAHRERETADLHLAQLGMAIEIINHEFGSAIKTVRRSIRSLGEWARANENLRPIVEELKTAYENLDGYLALFTPLHRRIYRTRTEITGASIARYVFDLFSERLQRHSTSLLVTDAFVRHSFTGYPSSFFPVFVNLVDNALFWLGDSRNDREIRIDVRNQVMLVSDSGPGVPKRDRALVFERGFSRKPGGLGLGLYVSREVLRKEGFRLELLDGAGKGSTFAISPENGAP